MSIYDWEASLEAMAIGSLVEADVVAYGSRDSSTVATPFVHCLATSAGTGDTQTIVDGRREWLTWNASLDVSIWVARDVAAGVFSGLIAAVRQRIRADLLNAVSADDELPHLAINVRESGSARQTDQEHNLDTYTITFDVLVGTRKSAINSIEGS